MSSETQPIDPERFALALEGLPLDALHSKVAEIRNSLLHLKASNTQMLPFADAGDQDCKEAMFENLAVIGRMNQRVELIRVEVVEKRGMPWVGEDGEAVLPPSAMNGTGDDGGPEEHGRRPPVSSGRLTDEELRRQLEAQMGDDEDEEGGNGGVHL